MDSIRDEEEENVEQAALLDHELKIMDIVDRLGRLIAVPQKSKPMTALDLLRRRVDRAEKSYVIAKAEIDGHGLEMGIYMLREQGESIEDSKLEN